MQHSNRLAVAEPRWSDSREVLAAAGSVLLIEATQALSLLNPRPGAQTVVVTHRRLLSRKMLETVRPDVIVAPLIAAEWDLVELGEVLEDLGYCGVICALSRPLPRGDLILGELGALYPGLTFRMVEAA